MWRSYRIYPDKAAWKAEDFYAPSLQVAFVLARSTWPSARSWTVV